MPHAYAGVEWLLVDTFALDWGETNADVQGLRAFLFQEVAAKKIRARGGKPEFPAEVYREDVVERMREKGMELRILDEQSEGVLHPIEDRTDDNYIAEAHAVFAVWRDLQPSTLSKMGKTPKQQILDFLAERFPNLSKNQHEHIAALLNPEKSGGAPTSKK